jgi:hypothetical protein
VIGVPVSTVTRSTPEGRGKALFTTSRTMVGAEPETMGSGPCPTTCGPRVVLMYARSNSAPLVSS